LQNLLLSVGLVYPVHKTNALWWGDISIYISVIEENIKMWLTVSFLLLTAVAPLGEARYSYPYA
jgi:hypothetical protein